MRFINPDYLPSKPEVCGPASASVGLVLAAAAQQWLIDACGKPLQSDVGPVPGNVNRTNYL